MQNRHDEPQFSLGAVARLTGLSPDVLRAWERRYQVVKPVRTPGGSRRYTEPDVQRLRLLGTAVRAGHRIGDLATLSDDQIQTLLEQIPHPEAKPILDEIFESVLALDDRRLEELLTGQFLALGPRRFARNLVQPLLRRVGQEWEAGRLSVASEHLASAFVRSLLGAALRLTAAASFRPAVIFTTPSGELHEFGTLIAALCTVGDGGNGVYLGPNLPVEELVESVRHWKAKLVVLGRISLDAAPTSAYLVALRAALPPSMPIWVGGERLDELPHIPMVRYLPDLDSFERGLPAFLSRLSVGPD